MTNITSADLAVAFTIGFFIAAVSLGLLSLFLTRVPRARVCAWCRTVQAGGYLPATHGMCSRCRDRHFERSGGQEPAESGQNSGS